MDTDWHRFRQLSHIILMRRIAAGDPKARLQEKQKGQCQLDIGLLRCHPLRKFYFGIWRKLLRDGLGATNGLGFACQVLP